MKGENLIENKSFDFAVRVVNLHKYLTQEQKEYVMSKQLLRCGTSIGANVSEAQRGQSMADFAAKMSVALKESNETLYWLRLLNAADYITNEEFSSMQKDLDELISLLVSICKKQIPNK